MSEEKTKIQELKDNLKDIAEDLCENVISSRTSNDNVRFCRWEGQSPDGRKHADLMGEAGARPFEGASDARIRMADEIINYHVALLTAAATRSNARIMGMETTDEARAGRIGTLLRWVLRNQLAQAWRREVKKLAQYRQGDCPALGFLGIYWEQKFALEAQSLSMEQLAKMILQAFGEAMTEDDKIRFGQMFAVESMEDEAVMILQRLIEGLQKDEARKAVRELRENQRADFNREYLRVNLPRVAAHRLYDDIFIPSGTVDMDSCPGYFVREWITEEELRGRITTEEYDEDVVLEMIGTKEIPGSKGKTFLSDVDAKNLSELLDSYLEDHDEEYEVLTAYYKSSTNNVTGIYCMVFSGEMKEPLKDAELLNYAHGRYPVIAFPREILGNRLVDSRGVPELVMSEQHSEKLLTDSFEDYTQISTIPPIKRVGPRPRTKLLIGPMLEVPVKRPDDAEWMKPPAYPIGNDRHREAVEIRVYRYFGMPHPQIAESLTLVTVQDMVDDFLSPMKDALTMIVQLCQQFMTDEDIVRVTGGKGNPAARSRQEIQGIFDMEISYDARDMNMDYLLKKLKLIREMVLPIDIQGTIGRAALVSRMLQAIDPALADEAIVDEKVAGQRETEDEELNFVKITAGIEPPMVAEGQNHALRLQVLMNIGQKNPEAIQKLGPSSQEILKKRMEHLQFQMQQAQNAMIGRVGAVPALGGGMQQ